MVRTIIIPTDTQIHLSIPKDYVGKQLEVLLYATDELKPESKTENANAARFKGLLPDDEAIKYYQHIEKARIIN